MAAIKILRRLLVSLKIVLGRPAYGLLALATASFIFVLGQLLPYLKLLVYLVGRGIFGLGELGRFFYELVLLKMAGEPLAWVLSLGLALGAGVNLALLVFYWQQRRVSFLAGGTSFLAWLIALVSFSCLACGSLILASLLGVSLAAAFISFLPGQGLALGWLSFGLLLFSSLLVSDKIFRVRQSGTPRG